MRKTSMKHLCFSAVLLSVTLQGWAVEFSAPAEWHLVNTNTVAEWNAEHRKTMSPTDKAWPGVFADMRKREVRLLAEAVGHLEGITAEFLLVGPLSDRAYESVAVTVASPGDIVRAIEHLGLSRGGGVGSKPFRFWPCGERMVATVRRLDVKGATAKPLQSLVADQDSESPLVGEGGIVFTGGRWEGDVCLTDSTMPASVISLYNESGSILDVPFQVGQSDVYGRLSVAEMLPYGTLLEIVLRPLFPPDGQTRVLPLTITVTKDDGKVKLVCASEKGDLLAKGELSEMLLWLKARADAGRELFATLVFDDALPLGVAAQVAQVFCMLDGKGLRLDGKAEDGLFPKAFVPLEKWREHKDRIPQPFELHLFRDSAGEIRKKMIFIEEDWTVEGLDPKLTPRTYPFESWDEFPDLIARVGGADNKVLLLFIFSPADLPLSTFMPGVRVAAKRLPLVYVFSE